MKKYSFQYFVFLLSSLSTLSIAFATDYNYLPADVSIKQKEAESALGYRLQTLENQQYSNPEISVINIEGRITELEQEREVEKNYIKGLYAKNGIVNQLQSVLVKIDAKYTTQIESLQSQKQVFQSQVTSNQNLKDEKQELQKQIEELRKQQIQQLGEYNNLLDEKINSYRNTSIIRQVVTLLDSRLKSSDENVVFSYLDSLPINGAITLGGEGDKLKNTYPEMYKKVLILYNTKYPHGKAGTSGYEDYLKTQPAETKVNELNKPRRAILKKEETKNTPLAETSSTSVFINNTTKPRGVIDINTEVEVQHTPFIQRTFNFLKRFSFWNNNYLNKYEKQ